MRIRFTIRRVLLIMLLLAPILAIVGGYIRANNRTARLARERVERISKYCDRLGLAPENLGTWALQKQRDQRKPHYRELRLTYREPTANREIQVDLFGAGHREVYFVNVNGPYVMTDYANWACRDTRKLTCSIDDQTETKVTCFDLYANSLDKTQQVLRVYAKDGQWYDILPSTNKLTPACAVRITIQPTMENWQNKSTDPDLIQFAELFLAELQETLHAPASPTKK